PAISGSGGWRRRPPQTGHDRCGERSARWDRTRRSRLSPRPGFRGRPWRDPACCRGGSCRDCTTPTHPPGQSGFLSAKPSARHDVVVVRKSETPRSRYLATRTSCYTRHSADKKPQSRERRRVRAVAAMPSSRPTKPRPSVVVALTDTEEGSITSRTSARASRMAERWGATRTDWATTVVSQPATYQPASKAAMTAVRIISREFAPSHAGSSDGKYSPMSPKPAAPRIESTTAWATTSPSDVACTPRDSSTTTPARISGGSPPKAWASYPQPTRASVPRYIERVYSSGCSTAGRARSRRLVASSSSISSENASSEVKVRRALDS